MPLVEGDASRGSSVADARDAVLPHRAVKKMHPAAVVDGAELKTAADSTNVRGAV